jgi:hypothetical protein
VEEEALHHWKTWSGIKLLAANFVCEGPKKMVIMVVMVMMMMMMNHVRAISFGVQP